MNKNKNSDKQMREKLSGFSVQPPSHVWENVQVHLATQQRRKRIIYFGRISAAAVVLLAFLAGWYFNNNDKIITPVIAEQQTIQPENKRNAIDAEKEKSLSTELVKEQQSQNENNQVINSNKNEQKTDIILVAATQKTEKKNDIVSTPSIYEREEITMLKSIEPQFEIEQSEILLAEIYIPQKEYNLTVADKFLMASNATSVKSKRNSKTGWKIGVGVGGLYDIP